jgi:hypothetical protein
MRHRFVLMGSLSLVLAVAGYACGSGHTGGMLGQSSGSGGAGAGASAVGGGDAGLFPDHGAAVSLAVSPAMTTIDVTNGVASSVPFTATVTYADTSTAVVAANWSFSQLDIALIDGNGNLTPNGMLGGQGTVTAVALGLTATASVTVILHVTQNPAMLSMSSQALFGTPSANPSGTLLYPYDQTVFARGLLPPELQWTGGVAGDAYFVHLAEKFLDAQFYVNADPPSRFTMPSDVWTQLTQSNAGEPVTLDIERLSAGVAYQSMHESWTIAQGSLRGSIYYWSVSTGQLMRIAPGAASPTVLFDSGSNTTLDTPAPASYDGTMPPWATGGNGKRCVACHTVSKDGSTVAAIFEKTGSTASPWGTVDLTQTPPAVVQMTPYTSTTIFLGLTPDGSYAVANDTTMTLALANAMTGAPVASALDSFTDSTCDPAFSPDGTHLAFSGNVTGSYPVEFSRADLDVIDFDAATLTFSNRRMIAPGGTQAIAFPSFTPDSAWVVYQQGTYSRAKYGTSSVGEDDLFMTDLAMMTGPLALSNASGATLPTRDQHLAYQPTVNPIAVGGYVWVVFVSPRDYGNEMLSVSNPTYENRKQLWVAAVDVDPKPGTDPSHPAFWLPGQDLSTINMSGYWALAACVQTGTSCDQGYECCTGFCQAGADGGGAVCVPAPSGCSQLGDKCTTSSDCCNTPAVTCIGGFCSQAQPT